MSPEVDGDRGMEPAEFSLAPGGAFQALWRRHWPPGSALAEWRRRLIGLPLLAWAPLLALSIAEGRAWGGGVALTFLRDADMNVRLLLALPALIVGELVVQQRLPRVVSQFLERGLVRGAARAEFDAAIAGAMRLRNSLAAEILLLAFSYGMGVPFVWRTLVALDVTSWFGDRPGGVLALSPAGWWAVGVSLPMFQFLLLRWYFRLFVLARFLWRVSRIDLHLVPTHPDRCAGLGFLTAIGRAFSPLLLAQGALLAGMMANRIFHAGATLPGFGPEIAGIAVLMVSAVLGPLLVFGSKLQAVKVAGLLEYGALAQRYVRAFDDKWLHGGEVTDASLIGSADIQSLADLSNAFGVVASMRLVPFGLPDVLQLAATTLLPVAPLLLTTFSVEELLQRLLRVIF